jgi:hypothetical protein
MSLLEIPTQNDLPAYEQLVKLDGTAYTIALYFNPRVNDGNGSWFITLADQNRNMLVGPIPLIVSWALFEPYTDLVELPGTIFAFDTSGEDADAGQFDLGDRVRLFYLEGNTA